MPEPGNSGATSRKPHVARCDFANRGFHHARRYMQSRPGHVSHAVLCQSCEMIGQRFAIAGEKKHCQKVSAVLIPPCYDAG
jgi:hypothetical protein